MQLGTPTRASSNSRQMKAASHWQRDIASQLDQLQSRSTATTYQPPNNSFQSRSTKNNRENHNPYLHSSSSDDDDRPLPDITNLTNALQSPPKAQPKYFTQPRNTVPPSSPNPLATLAALHATIAKLEQEQQASVNTIQQLQQQSKSHQESTSLHSIQQLAHQAQQQQHSSTLLTALQSKVAHLDQLLQAQSTQTHHLAHQLNTATHRSAQDTTALDHQLTLINQRLATLEKQIQHLRNVVQETVLLSERGRGWEIEEEARRQVMAPHDPTTAKPKPRPDEDLDKTPRASAAVKPTKGKEAIPQRAGSRTPSSVGSGSRRSVLEPGEIERLLADQAREVLLRSPIPKPSHQRRESTAQAQVAKEHRPTTRRPIGVTIESGSGSSSSSSASSVILAARKRQDQRARQALLEKEKERVYDMEKLRKAVHQPVLPHVHQHQEYQHVRPESRLDQVGAKGKENEKSGVCKICRQKRNEIDEDELEYIGEDPRIRSAPAKLQHSHSHSHDQRRTEQTPLERHRQPAPTPAPVRTRTTAQRRGDDQRRSDAILEEVGARAGELGGTRVEGLRSKAMRENERKKDDWVSRLGNLKDDFLIHEKLYLEISDRHRKMDLEDSRRLLIADHLKESIDSLEGKAIAYLRVRSIVETEAWL